MTDIKVSPPVALLLIEEGFAIKVNDDIYQRNQKIDYFNYKRWRKSEEYAISCENRNKIYNITNKNVLTREELLNLLNNQESIVIPPIGGVYTTSQYKTIYYDAKRLIKIFIQCLNSTS